MKDNGLIEKLFDKKNKYHTKLKKSLGSSLAYKFTPLKLNVLNLA